MHDRLHQPDDVSPSVLLVTIRIDDDVRTLGKACFKRVPECSCQANILGVAHDLVYAQLARNLDYLIRRNILHDQVFDYVHAVDAGG